MSKRSSQWKRLVLAALGVALFSAASLSAQTGTTDETKRKVKTKAAPTYPDLARRMNVTGKVKIEVVIAPDGHVKSTKIVGGHPLLVPPSVDAAKEWKFMPAAEETTQVIEFEFKTAN